jgi:hypothetical protein
MKFFSQITFLYFEELKEPALFFEDTLGLEKVDDQGFAKIYRISDGAFLGIVDASQGYCKAAAEQNTLITLVSDDVHQWYEHLISQGVRVDAPPKFHARAKVECFFFQGPGGYAFEVQRFLNPDVSKYFQ